ncbi:MAG: hypothetical protein QOE80_2579 [Actinomycetota bacterium]|nr:hypothetical protein [Actinomycetota bacterium]
MFTLLTAVAVTTFAAPIARASEPSLPVLWEGTIAGPDGQPAPGTEVVAFARPAGADLLPTESGLVPVARSSTDRSGHYVLRTGRTEALRTVESDSGWTNVMVAAFGPDGSFSLATDSIAWEPAGGFRATGVDDNPNHGRWLTTPADRAAAEAGSFRATVAPDPDAVGRDRPAVMTLAGGSNRPIKAQAAKPPPLRQEGMCAGPFKTQKLEVNKDVGYTPVGELHLDRGWGGQFVYTTTRSTSFQVGARHDGGSWYVAGSSSSLKDSAARNGNERGLTEGHMYTFAADLDYERSTWRCNQGDSWHWAEMVEPASWRGGIHRSDFGAAPGCNPDNRSPVAADAFFDRSVSDSTTLDNAVSVLGFSGSMTSTISRGVVNHWDNLVHQERFLCGTSQKITGHDTRVVSLP